MTKENQTISTITSERDGGRHGGTGSGGGGIDRGCGGSIAPNVVAQQAIYERDRLTQVKTYTDHGNGYGQRQGGTTHYSKVRMF